MRNIPKPVDKLLKNIILYLEEIKMPNKFLAILYAIAAAFCYSVSTPVSKILLNDIRPVFIAGLVYTGAGLGMLLINLLRNRNISKIEAKITKKRIALYNNNGFIGCFRLCRKII
jgi:drug/metabolite transporter (DMT)-like permease